MEPDSAPLSTRDPNRVPLVSSNQRLNLATEEPTTTLGTKKILDLRIRY